MNEVPCRHTIELRRHEMNEPPEPPEITEKMINEKVSELLDVDLELINEAICVDAWPTKEHKKKYNKFLSEIGGLIAYENWPAIGELIGKRAQAYIKNEAQQRLEDEN